MSATDSSSGSPSTSWALQDFKGTGYDKGRSVVIQVLWLVTSSMIMPWWVPNRVRVSVLRLFGAVIGERVLIRHRVRIHWPWKLAVGDNSWIGEGTWILNLEPVQIGHDTCISQDVLLCAGSHNRRSPSFEFDNGPILIGDGVWIGARATVLRNVQVGSNSVVGATALVVRSVAPNSIIRAPLEPK